MREILFRGKRCDNGKWVQGCLVKFGKESFTDDDRYGIMDKTVLVAKTHKNRCAGLVFDYCDYIYHNIRITEIIPKTVGQFTGLTDKNGKKIFDGDIIEWFAQGESERPDFGYIEYDEQSFAWRVCWQKYDPGFMEGMQQEYISVIGNIHDNPELL